MENTWLVDGTCDIGAQLRRNFGRGREVEVMAESFWTVHIDRIHFSQQKANQQNNPIHPFSNHLGITIPKWDGFFLGFTTTRSIIGNEDHMVWTGN